MVNTNDHWIQTRTGIRERRILQDGATSDLGAEAAKLLIERNNVDPGEIEAIIVSTITPDMFFPNTACLIREKIRANNAFCFDVSAACSGFIFGLETVAQFIQSGRYKKILFIAADKMSAITDYTDRNTCILFGDAGAALLIEPSPDPAYGLLDSKLYSDGSGAAALHMKGGGSLHPPTHETVDKKMHYIYQDGKVVFKVAVAGMADVSEEMMKRNNLTADDLDWLVPHQANMRIITATADRAKLDMSKVMVNIEKYGNTTAATIPLCLSEYSQQGKLRKGHRLILVSFGAGYTWGSMYLRWSFDRKL
jgi:3-oxoacyl-[acyl-carrier-protein] synthase-3